MENEDTNTYCGYCGNNLSNQRILASKGHTPRHEVQASSSEINGSLEPRSFLGQNIKLRFQKIREKD